MATLQDLIDEGRQVVLQRAALEQTWDYISRLIFPAPDRMWPMGQGHNAREMTEGWASGNGISEKMRRIYDNTAIIALERMTAGITSLITPDNEKWEEITAGGPFEIELSDDEKKWCEKVRNFLFRCRYDPKTGWAAAHYNAVRAAAAFGTGMYLITESYENPVKIPYIATGLRLSECYLQNDITGQENGFFRFYSCSARQLAAVEEYDCSEQVKKWAGDPTNSARLVPMMHWIGEGKKVGSKMRFGSWHIEVEHKHVCRRSGFNYWPVVCYHWNKYYSSPYGEGAASLVLAEVATTNVLAKNNLLSAQQYTRPPVAMADDSSMSRPNLNPGAINLKAIDNNGRLKIQPLITATNPSLAHTVLEASRAQVQAGLYTNLWQVLLEDPRMTATQALIKNNEKGEILSPVGSGIQRGLSVLTEAELEILKDKGAFNPDSQLAPPETLGGRDSGTKFASPLDRLRRSRELIGIKSVLEVTAETMQFDPQAKDNIDVDEIIRLTSEISGAPATVLRDRDKIDEMRQQQAGQQALATAAMLAKTAGPGVKAAADAAKTASETPPIPAEAAAQGAQGLAQLGIGAPAG